MTSDPGKPVTIYDVAGLIGKAYVKAFTKENIEKGFKVSGIYAYDENVFKEHEFLSSFVTDRPIPDVQTFAPTSEERREDTEHANNGTISLMPLIQFLLISVPLQHHLVTLIL